MMKLQSYGQRAQLCLERLETRALLATVLKSGHLHLQMNFSNGAWGGFEIENTTNGNTYDPKDVLIFVDKAQKETQPSGWDFIGAGEGNPYWRLDSSSSSPYVSLSVATEHIPNSTFDVYQPADPRVTFSGEWIKLELIDVQGPGEISSWQNGQPPSWWMSSYDNGQTLDSAFYIEPGGHTHLNWGFSKVGVHKATFQASAYFNGGPEPVLSEEVVLKFGVEMTRRPPNNPAPIPPTDDEISLSIQSLNVASTAPALLAVANNPVEINDAASKSSSKSMRVKMSRPLDGAGERTSFGSENSVIDQISAMAMRSGMPA